MESNVLVPGARRLETSQETIEITHAVDAQCWDAFVRQHPHGTLFHLMGWQRLIENALEHEPLHIVARASGTAEVAGILPLFLVRSRIFGRMLVSTPQAAYGGILARSDAVAGLIFERARRLAAELSVEFLELRSFHNALGSETLLRKDLYVTFRQQLQPDPDANMLAIPRKTRAEVREGARRGLEFKVNEISVREFFNVYSRSVRDLGTPTFPRRLFEGGLREFGSDCKLFSVHWRGKLASAVWTLFYKDEIVPYFGGSIREYNPLAVNSFMYGSLMKYGCENGYRVFDFGRSKKGSGSFHFKKRWGMTMTDLPYEYLLVRRENMPDTSPMNPKFQLCVKAWRRLPLFLTRGLGPVISRHLI